MLFADFTSGTPYERALAGNLVDLEWERQRHLRFLDQLILAKYRDLAMGVFHEGEVGTVLRSDRTETVEDLSYALVSSDASEREATEDPIAECQITPGEIQAKAYQKPAENLEPQERKLAEIEVRRRRPREDFDALTASGAKPVEKPEVLASA